MLSILNRTRNFFKTTIEFTLNLGNSTQRFSSNLLLRTNRDTGGNNQFLTSIGRCPLLGDRIVQVNQSLWVIFVFPKRAYKVLNGISIFFLRKGCYALYFVEVGIFSNQKFFSQAHMKSN